MVLRRMIAICVCFSLVSALACSCTNPASTSPASPEQPAVRQPGPADQVQLVYFHTKRRCEACIYAEERIGYIVKTFFPSEADSGNLTYGIFDLSDKDSAEVASKYGAVGSQLFVNVTIGGAEYIRHIDEIWYWGCIDNEPVFDETVKSLIEKGLYGEG